MKINPTDLIRAAASVRGARSMGIDTSASIAAMEALVSANKWLAETVPDLSEYDPPAVLMHVDAVAAAAAELSSAAGVQPFEFCCNEIISRGYVG